MNRLSFLATRGNLISVTIAGEGSPLMLLHGFPLDHRLWLQQLDSLSAFYRVIAPDLRGFGQSTLTEEPYSLADLAGDVEQVRQHLTGDQPIALCGLSMGGYVAFEYWRGYSRSLTALILANTKPEADTDQARDARHAMVEQARQLGSWQAVSGMLPKLLSGSHMAERGAAYHAAEQMLRAADRAEGHERKDHERLDLRRALEDAHRTQDIRPDGHVVAVALQAAMQG